MTDKTETNLAIPSAKRPMRILTIDGGGMKGVYACSYLHSLETHFGKKLGEVFDLVAGTSTGGIIALGIGAGKSAGEILDFYKEHGSSIFPSGGVLGKYWRRLTLGHGYHNSALYKALESVLRDKTDGHLLTMAESCVRLCVPAVYANNCQPRVFKSRFNEPQVEHLKRDLPIKMCEVALATSAAPWYLPIVSIDEGHATCTYIDGGLWANNPSLVAFTEAMNYYCGEEKEGEKREFDGIQMLSIGLPNSVGFDNSGKYQRGMKLIPQLLAYSFESSKAGVHQSVQFLLKDAPNQYYRVAPTNLTPQQAARLALDNANQESINELTMLGHTDAQNHKNHSVIKEIFT